LSRDTNDEGLAFKTGVGSLNYFDTNQNRSLQVTSDGEQSLVILRTTWATVEKKITVSSTGTNMDGPGMAVLVPLEQPVGGLVSAGDAMEVTQPGDPGYMLPRDLQVQNTSFDTAVALARHATQSVESLQGRWSRSRKRLIGQQSSPADEQWDLEKGGGQQLAVPPGSLVISIPANSGIEIPTPVTELQ